MTIKDDIIAQRKTNKQQNKAYIDDDKTQQYLNELLDYCSIYTRDIQKYIDNNVTLVQDIVDKIKDELTVHDICQINLNNYQLKLRKQDVSGPYSCCKEYEYVEHQINLSIENYHLISFIEYLSDNKFNHDAEKVEQYLDKQSFKPYNLGFIYQNQLPYSEYWQTSLKFKYHNLNIRYTVSYDSELEYTSFNDYLTITIDVNALKKYLNQQGLIIDNVKKNTIEISLA